MIARYWSAYLLGLRRPAVPLERLEEHGREQREHPRLGRVAALPPALAVHEVVVAEAALRDGGHGVADVGQDGLEDARLRVAQRGEDLAEQRQRFRALNRLV